MTHWKLAGSTALATLFLASGAWSQVTPEDVWANWQAQYLPIRAVSAARVTREGDTLVVSGLSIKVDQEGVIVDTTIETVSFRDQGDGTVGITMSESYPIALTLPSDDPESLGPAQVGLVVTHPGLSMVASGSATEPAYAFDAPTLGIRLDSLQGVPADAAQTTAEMALTALKGTYAMAAAGDLTSLRSEFTLGGLTANMTGKDDETQGDVRVAVSMADLAGSTNGNLMDVAAMENMAKALAAGFATDGRFTYGATTMDLDVTEAGKPTKIVANATGGGFSFGIDAQQMAYGATGTGVNMTFSGGDIPFPEVKLSYADSALEFVSPVSTSDTPQDFRALFKIIDLAVSDEIWGIFDPTGQLPRDPATVIVDAKGTARLTTDMMDEAAMAALGEAAPGELNSVDLTELRARIAGAELSGTGAMTFDNTDLATFGGFPAPTGTIDLMLTGGNTLLDKLVAMGIVPEEEAMGYRMMVSMFANTAADSDTLTSQIEFKDKGIFVNGQQMQ
jgi:hypothetical protein